MQTKKSRVGSYVLKYVGSTLLYAHGSPVADAVLVLLAPDYTVYARSKSSHATNASRSSHQSAARAVLRSTPHGHGHKMR